MAIIWVSFPRYMIISFAIQKISLESLIWGIPFQKSLLKEHFQILTMIQEVRGQQLIYLLIIRDRIFR